MVKIGNINIDGKVMLAPMAGYTFSAYRKFMFPFGVSLSVTEMVSDCGINYGNKETLSYTVIDKDEPHPIGLQLFGNDPEILKNAVKNLQKQGILFDFIDINMGCPVPKVTKQGSGSSLMKTPKKCGEIISAIKEVTDLPITAKIRLGWDDKSINFKEVIFELEKAGVSMIGIHARTTKQLYSGKPQWELLKNIKKEMHVPLAVSGDIFTLDDAINAIDITGADLVMVARGGVGNPNLIKQIDTYFKSGLRIPDADIFKQKDYCLELAQMIIKEKGEISGIKIFKSIGPKFFTGFPNSKTLRNKIALEVNTYEDLKKVINDF